MLEFYNRIKDKGIYEFGKLIGHEYMFPTEERVEWKRKRKENKEKGIEVKKKVKTVENHHDDCGTDLSGLGTEEIDTLLSYEANYDSDEDNVSGMNTHTLVQRLGLGKRLLHCICPRNNRGL